MSHCAKIVFLQNFGDVKNEVFEKNIAFFVFSFFYVGEKETEKRREENGKAKQSYKNSVLRWSSNNVKSKNGFLATIA